MRLFMLLFLFALPITLYAQDSTLIVTGRIVDQEGSPIPGVNVQERGSSNGIVTDIDGFFSLEVSKGTKLIFSFVGYKTKEVEVENNSTVIVKFNTDINFPSVKHDIPTGKHDIHEESVPKFKIPPPKPSARHILERAYFKNCTSMRNVNDVLIDALKFNGYIDKSYYSVPNGFAVATRIEKINPDGTCLNSSDRWTLSYKPTSFSISDYLRALFFGPKGYYRVIVFAITDKSFNTSKNKVSKKEAQAWLSDGNLTLPESIAKKKFTNKHEVIALIYEFIKTESSSNPQISDPSNLIGLTHLNRSKILTWLENQQN